MTGLRRYSLFVLLAMLAVTTWASFNIALWKTPREVVIHPWFIATLFDAYFGFFFFWIWLAWRENHWPKAIGQFLKDYGTTGVQGIAVWAILAPFIGFIIYGISRPVLIRMVSHHRETS